MTSESTKWQYNFLPGETVAIVWPQRAKSATLLFDRIITTNYSSDEDPPDDVQFWDRRLRINFEDPPVPETFLLWNEMADRVTEVLEGEGINAVAVHETGDSFSKRIVRVGRPGIAAVLDQIAIVDDNGIEWEQVLEFRQDNEAKKKYRKLRLWLNKEMVGKSPDIVSDLIATKLDDYHWAVKKHGLKTVNGALTAILDPKVLLGVSVTAGTVLAGGGWTALLPGLFTGTLTVGKVAVWLSEVLIDREEVRRGPNSEVAYIYDVLKDLTK